MSERTIRARLQEIELPQYVVRVLSIFEDNGYEAYVVGGAVRDLLRGEHNVNDYDVTTNALPEETKRLFSGYMIYETGIKHGTVTVNVDGNMVEITTYRTDGEYADSRHPDNVTFTRNIIEDLARRDFTVNAMALSLDGRLVDPFDGVYDLSNAILRAVGDPSKRFSEDALRIMRLYRFSAQLCFDIEKETLEATQKCAQGLNNISKERIVAEWEKLLTSVFCRKSLDYMYKYGIFDVIFPNVPVSRDLFDRIELMKAHYPWRSALLFKEVPLDELPVAIERICLKKSDFEEITGILTALNELRQNQMEHVNLFAYEYQKYAFFAATIAWMEGSAKFELWREIRYLLEGGLPITSRFGLCVYGGDLIRAGVPDRSWLSPIFSLIIRKVVCEELENERTAIYDELPKMIAEIEQDKRSAPDTWRKMRKYRIK